MDSTKYAVAFCGQLGEGRKLEAVKQGVAKLFKVDVGKIEHLFSGKWVVIKKGLEKGTAHKYQQALVGVGAICRVVEEGEVASLRQDRATENPKDTADSQSDQQPSDRRGATPPSPLPTIR